MRAVDHRVAHVQFGQVLDQRLDIADLFLLLAPTGRGAGGEQLGFGDEIEAILQTGKADGQPGGGDAERLVAALELQQRVKRGRIDAAGAQEVEQALAPAVALGQQQHAVLGVADVGLQARQRLFGATHHGQVAEFVKPGVVLDVVNARASAGPLQAGERGGPGSDGQLRMCVGARIEGLGAQEQRFGRKHRALGVALHQAVALLRVLPEMLERGFQVAMQHHGRVGSQVVEHRGGVIKEQRQVVLDAGGGHAVADVLVDAALGRVAFEQFAPAAAELRPRRVVHRKFTTRQQPHFGHRVQAALAVGVEGADAVDLVVEQVHAVRYGRTHREQINQPTAHRVFARAHHLRDVAVARQRELRP